MKQPNTTLEQWLSFIAVVDEGSFAKAADALNKSQSAISYAIANLEAQLPAPLMRQQGRRAVLTEAGEVLYRRARQLLDNASDLELTAQCLADGWATKLVIAVDSIVPMEPVLSAIRGFNETAPQTRITLLETTLSGTDEALLEKRVDLMLGASLLPGFNATPLTEVCMIPVAHPNHGLTRSKQPLKESDLKSARQIVVRDSGSKRTQDKGWLEAEQRFTVSHFATAVKALEQGIGFAWLPLSYAEPGIQKGTLKKLHIESCPERKIQIYLVSAMQDVPGPAMAEFARQLRENFSPS